MKETHEWTLQKPALVAGKFSPRAETLVYWTVTALFCLQMSFTAHAELRLAQVEKAFIHLGFPVGDGAEAWGWAAATSVLWGFRTSSGGACMHSRRVQIALSAAKLCARVGAVHERVHSGGICLCIHRREN